MLSVRHTHTRQRAKRRSRVRWVEVMEIQYTIVRRGDSEEILQVAKRDGAIEWEGGWRSTGGGVPVCDPWERR